MTVLPLIASLVLAVGLDAVEEDIDSPLVDVGGFAIEPMANLTWRDHTVEWHPKALVGGGWNSNLFADARDIGAPFIALVAGSELRWRVSPRQLVVAEGEIEDTQYLGQGEGDLVGGRGQLAFRRQGEVLVVSGHARWARSQQPQEQTGEQIAFDRVDGDIEGDRRGYVSHVVAGLSADRVAYREDSVFFGQHQRDATSYAGRVRGGRAYATDSEWYVRLRFGQTRYDHEDRFQSSVAAVAAIGAEQLLATRTQAFAELGVDARSYDDDFAHDPSYGDQRTLYPVGTLGVRWTPEPLSGAELRLTADVYDSVSSNAAWYYGPEWYARLRLRERLFAFSDGFVHRATDSGAAAGRIAETRTTIDIGGGLGYRMRDGIATRVRAGWTNSTSNVGRDYQRVLLAIEVGLVL